jgi:hypothetical protein
MNDLNEEKNNKDNFDERNFDPTKEAFFSDLGNMEEEIASEAYELVAHALSLLESQYYDDSIEILRQAIGLYEQINRKAEIEALLRKISDIYVLKENVFKESEIEADNGFVNLGEISPIEPSSEDLAFQAEDIILEAKNLVEKEKFESALDRYDEALNIFKSIDNQSEIKVINKLIEECYNKKAEFLRTKRKTEIVAQKTLSEDELKAQRLRAFEEAKIREDQLSEQAFDLVGRATDYAKIHQYDDALRLYEEGARLFQDINWDNEHKKILTAIEQIKIERDNYLKKVASVQKEAKIQEDIEVEKEEEFLEKVKKEEEIKLQAEAKKIREMAERRKEEEEFKKQISDMVNNAEKMAREYGLQLKKEIREGILTSVCVYPEIIKIYENIRSMVIERGWNDEAVIYTRQINHYSDLFEKDKKLREIEAQKAQKEKKYEDLLKISSYKPVSKISIVKKESEEKNNEIEYKKQIEDLINSAERMARDYDIAFKQAIKKGNLDIESKYPLIIEFYIQARNLATDKGWSEDVAIYSSQIKKYNTLLEKENRVREIEARKYKEMKEFEKTFKIKESSGIDIGKLKSIEIRKKEDEAFQKEITQMVDNAEKIAREYEIAMKKAIKEGKIIEKSPYPDIIEIYNSIRDKVYSRGWQDQTAIYTNQIRIYQEKMKNDIKLREIETQKIEKEKEFEELQKVKRSEKIAGLNTEKLKKTEEKLIKDKLDEEFELEIDKMVDKNEKMARDYELAIKRGQFDIECPYDEIVESYKEIRKKVLVRGWQEEAEIYSNQVKLYMEKLEKDKRLRELEAQKVKKQREFEDSLKVSTKLKRDKYKSLKMSEIKESETEELLNRAMNYINEAENNVRSYELSMKKDILIYSSPYDDAISNYEKARKIFKDIGWTNEANRLVNTINFYKEKKNKDNELREVEKQKLEEAKLGAKVPSYIPSEEPFAKERQIIDFEKAKQQKTKESDQILDLINKAERMAQEYESKKKEGILKVNAPYQEIIGIYKSAKKGFEEIGWQEQADQLNNSINYYKEKSEADNRLRNLELEKIKEQEVLIQKQRREAKLAREAEAELLKQKMEAVEIKRKQALEYEAKKSQAFSLMDLAKKELNQNNFENAIKYYKESEKIFAEINWLEGMKMIKDSINVISRKKEKFEQEKRLIKLKEEERKRMELQMKEQIAKAEDLQKLQQEQKRKEFMEIQLQKEKEKEISEQAYKLLEDGTKLMNQKKYDKAYEKYIMGRDLFQKLGWQHEVSRINNDLLFILKKEMKQTEKIKAMQLKKLEEEKEIKTLLKEAEIKSKELEDIRREEKRRKREEFIEQEMENANNIIKDLKYNEAIWKLKKVIKKSGKLGKEKLIKQIKKQIEILENASQVPLITKDVIERDEDMVKFELGYRALDRAQISLSNNQFMKAISEFNEAKFNLKDTRIGIKYLPLINEKINIFKNELGIKITPEEEPKIEAKEEQDITAKIAARRTERKKKIRELLGK